jgi:hypothetical protein
MLCGTPFPAGRYIFGGFNYVDLQFRRKYLDSGHINGIGVICVIIYENMRLAKY